MKYLALLCALTAAVMAASCATKSVDNPNVETFKAKGGKVEITCINHGSLAISYKGYLIQVDPVMNYGGKELDYGAFPKADLILITHEHGDHYSKETIEMVSKEGTRVIAPEKVHEMLGYGEIMANGESTNADKGIIIEAIPAYNTTDSRQQFHPKGNGNGYLLTIGGLRVLISGDSENIDYYSQLKDIDVAFLSANQPYTMTPRQCSNAAKAINPKVLIPYHLGNTDVKAIEEGLEGTGIEMRFHESLR